MPNQLISRIRRNHGLEHASVHILSQKHKNFGVQGNATHNGFYLNIYGDIDEQAIHDAVHTAHQRMKDGEHQLAVHPNCGTGLLTTAFLATLTAQAVVAFEQYRARKSSLDLETFFRALPNAILAVTLSLIVSRPLGLYLQAQYTTEGDLGNMEIINIQRIRTSIVARIFKLLLATNAPTASYKITTRA
ncbi:MAG TPA: DUF6391 domain-containing protein [Anaerolineae bacterium]|nr:DUF6391 domain-containing protein [Anaerolineae bacterium]